MPTFSKNEPDGDSVPKVRERTRAVKAPANVDLSKLDNQTQSRIEVEYVPTGDLKTHSKGLRKHSAKHIAGCMGSIRAFGFIAPILVDNENTVVDGHALVVAAERLGISEIPVVRLGHLRPELIQLCRVALNKLAEGGEWDANALRLEMIDMAPVLITHDIDVEALGFDVSEFDMMIMPAQPEEMQDESEVALEANAVTRVGDLWLLGDNKLLCGNALDDADFCKLLPGQKARMSFCDPPYNLKVDGVISGLGKVTHREFPMASGEMTREAFIHFLSSYMRNCAAHSMDGSVHFACMDWRHVLELVTAGEAAFDKFLNLVVWNKTNAGMGSMYRSQHELIGVFKAGKAPHKNNFGLGETGRYRTNVWTLPGANTFRKDRDENLAAHPTVKPTALVMDAILDVSGRGDIVLDCFCGSGTTILAAEKTGRRAYTIELDPLYVDVAIKRWQNLTGEVAILAGENLSFADIAMARSFEEGLRNG